MSKAKELYELHKKICASKFIVPESKDLYLKYTELSEKEEQELVDLLMQEYGIKDDDRNTMTTILYYIAMFSKGNSLYRVYHELIKSKVFYPAEIYLKAGETEAMLLIDELDNVDAKNILQINHILMCLAYIPCEIVKDFFVKSSKENAPIWTKKLHILPIEYTTCGGWTVDKNNQIKRLYSDEITVFKKIKGNNSSKAPLEKSKEVCPYCNNNLFTIFNDGYEIATCIFCSCYQNVHVKIDENGKARWHKKNIKSDLLDKILSRDTEGVSFDYGLEKTSEKRLPVYTINQFVSITKSQIGGMPTNINDPMYPCCPDCGEKMSFVAQLDMEDVVEYGEGMYYFFYCNDCKVVSSCYDQT